MVYARELAETVPLPRLARCYPRSRMHLVHI